MINRIKALLGGSGSPADAAERADTSADKHLVVAALLVEAAHVDASFDERERQVILDLVSQRFGLAPREAASLLDAAQVAQHAAIDLVGFTRRIKDYFSGEERIEVIEMLWEVVYADGRVDEFEASLMRRIGGLMYVSDRDRGAAQKRVAARRAAGRDEP